jgi:hypothetical protein
MPAADSKTFSVPRSGLIWSQIAAFYVRAAEMSRASGIPHEVDHIIPLRGRAVSGLHVHTNLQILSRTQNRAKQNSLSVIS